MSSTSPYPVSRPPIRLVLGVDAGGTTTRCVLLSEAGDVVGRGRAGGASQHSSADASGALGAAVRAALADARQHLGAPEAPVAAGVVGAAGAGPAGLAQAQELAARAWRAVGLAATPVVLPDPVVALAAGTTRHAGAVLIAGTGAVAAAVEGEQVLRRCDGYGWLLGDEGSAVWLGVRALRAVLSSVDGRGPATALTPAVAAALRVPGAPAEPVPALAQAIVADTYAGPPADLGRLAPVVDRCAAAGDEVARRLVTDAVDRLVRSTVRVLEDLPADAPLVVTGGVATSHGVVGPLLRQRLAAETGRVPVVAADGALGAARLALRRLPT